ncbi:unnamed protein product, partial [Amoebophrya sp. A25]
EELRHCSVILHVQDVTIPGNQQFWEHHDATRVTMFKAGIANAFDCEEISFDSPKFGLGGLLSGERLRFVAGAQSATVVEPVQRRGESSTTTNRTTATTSSIETYGKPSVDYVESGVREEKTGATESFADSGAVKGTTLSERLK